MQKASLRAKAAMEELMRQQIAEQKKKKEEKERLAKIKVDQEDVDTISDQFDIPKPEAERYLKLNDGDFDATATMLISN